MGHRHNHQTEAISDKGLFWAIVLNVILTVVEVIAGIFSGSLSLIGDAVHNGSDVAALLIALIARRWARRQPDLNRTFGYRRAAIVGAMINVTTLIIIGIFLLYESVMRFIDPIGIDGWIMIIVAGIALIVDLGTVLLMRLIGNDLNIRAALAHNLADALASIGVIIAGIAILVWNIAWFDPVLTAVIAIYILVQSTGMLKSSVAILMDSCPKDCDPEEIADALKGLEGVIGVHHMHIRSLDENYIVLDVHVVVEQVDANALEGIKSVAKTLLHDRYGIEHTTIEFEFLIVDKSMPSLIVTEGH